MVQLSDSTAIVILASVAGVYFTITAACSVIICRILCKRCCATSSKLPPKSLEQVDYEMSQMRGARGIRDKSDLVPGGRADKWRQYISSNQPVRNNGTSYQQNGNHTQERPKLPAIEEVGEGVGGLGGEEERENGSDDTHREEKPRESEINNQWWAKRKVKGRTNSTKLLLDESGSSWTLTSANGANGGGGGQEDSLALTASLPGPVLARCDRLNTIPVPRPVPRSGGIRMNARSASPQRSLATNNPAGTDSSGHRPVTQPASGGEEVKESPTTTTRQSRHRARKQLSLSTHSLPRRSTTTTTATTTQCTLESQRKALESGSSGVLPETLVADGATNGGSRPRLRRYASTSAYSSTPSLEPIVLVRPRSRGSRKRDSYQSNTLSRLNSAGDSVTSIEMERNYYTLQTRRVDLEAMEEGERGDEGEGGSRTLPEASEASTTNHDGVSTECTNETYQIAYKINSGEAHPPTLNYNGQDHCVTMKSQLLSSAGTPHLP